MNKPLGKRRFARAVREAQYPLCIELGAWQTKRAGWIATDVNWRCRAYLDVAQPWPLADNAVDFIFSDNVVEHLTLDQARIAFREAHRVLRPGGVMRVVTPDVAELVRLYCEGQAASAELRVQLVDEGYLVAHQVDILRFAFQDDGHHSGYLWDKDSMSTELLEAGFATVTFHSPAQSPHPELRDLDLRVDAPLGRAMLAAEAIKVG